MHDAMTPEARVIRAGLALAAARPWSDVSLLDIAAEAKITLADLRRHFGSKGEILAAFARAIDDELLAEARPRGAGQSARDAVFEVVMSRFDRLAPYRAALKSIHAAGAADPSLARALLASQAWMLNAAGVATDGIGGGIRVAGLASVYASVFAIWLEDDDPGLARTMAALDRRLRRGERTLSSLDELVSAAQRVASLFTGGGRAAGQPSAGSGAAAAKDAAAPGPASAG